MHENCAVDAKWISAPDAAHQEGEGTPPWRREGGTRRESARKKNRSEDACRI
jgi:hypothetical protein